MPDSGGIAVIVTFVVSIVVVALVLLTVFIKERSAPQIPTGPGPVIPPKKKYATIINWTQYIIEVVVNGVGYKINPGHDSSIPTGRVTYTANHSPHVMITSTDQVWIIGEQRPIQNIGGLKTITNLSSSAVQVITGIPSVAAQGPILRLSSGATTTIYTGNGFSYQLNDSSGSSLDNFSTIVGKKLYVTSDLKLTSSIISFINQNGSAIGVSLNGATINVPDKNRFTTVNSSGGFASVKDSSGNSIGSGVRFASNIVQVVISKSKLITNDSNADVSGIPSVQPPSSLSPPLPQPTPPSYPQPSYPQPPTNPTNGQQPVVPPPQSGSQGQGLNAVFNVLPSNNMWRRR